MDLFRIEPVRNKPTSNYLIEMNQPEINLSEMNLTRLTPVT